MRLTRLKMVGLKADDREMDIPPVLMLVGENGTGKTSVLAAMHLLAEGSAHGVPATPDGVMRLSRDDRELSVRGVFSDGTFVERSWKRDRSGSVKATVRTNLEGATGKASDTRGLVRAVLGGFAEAWDPTAIFRCSPRELRERLMRLLPPTEYSLDALVPSECPRWALPEALGAEDPETWIAAALAAVADKINAENADRRAAERLIEEDLGDGWAGEKPDEGLAAELQGLRRRLVDAHASTMLLGRYASAAKDFEARRARLGPPPVEGAALTGSDRIAELAAVVDALASAKATTRAEISQLDREIEAAERGATADVCPNCGHDLGAGAEETLERLRPRRKALQAKLGEDTAALVRAEAGRSAAEAETRSARMRVDAYAAEKRRLGEVEVELEILRAEQAELRPPTETVAELEAKIAETEKRWRALGAANERAEQYARAKADIGAVEVRITELKRIHGVLVGVEASMLKRTKAWLETRLSEAYGGTVAIRREGKDWWIDVDGADVTAKSDGEQIRLATALVEVTGAASRARWRPLLVDRGESVSAAYRTTFLAGIVASQASGAIDQAVICTCDPFVPDVEGVSVVRLARAEDGPAGRVTFVGDDAQTPGPAPGAKRPQHRRRHVSRTQPELLPDPDPFNGVEAEALGSDPGEP